MATLWHGYSSSGVILNKKQRAYIALHLRTWYLSPQPPRENASFVTLDQMDKAGIPNDGFRTTEKVEAYDEVKRLIANPPRVHND